MSRDANGNYTLPAGINPVVSDTVISTDWANPTMDDLAAEMTDSLSRSGQGGMLPGSQLGISDGLVGSPGLMFELEQTTGIYRSGAGKLDIVVQGILRGTFASNGLEVNGFVKGIRILPTTDGSDAAPAFSFDSSDDMGMFRAAPGILGLSTGGNIRVQVDSDGLTSFSGLRANNGTELLPSFAFAGDPNTGMYRVAADTLGFSANGIRKFTVNTSGATINDGQFFIQNGDISNIALTFAGDTDTGIIRQAANVLSIIAGGTNSMRFRAGGAYGPDGSVAVPTFSFYNDGNTGMYRPGADILGFVSGGAERLRTDGAGVRVVAAGTPAGPSLRIGGNIGTGLSSQTSTQLSLSADGVLGILVAEFNTVLYSGAIERFRSTTVGATLTGSLLVTDDQTIDKAGSGGVFSSILNDDGGVQLSLTAAEGFSLNQVSNAGVFQDAWIDGVKNGGVRLYHNGLVRLETLVGGLSIPNLPTSNPGGSGLVWRDAGTLKIT